MLEVGLDLVLVAGVGVDHVPLLGGALVGIGVLGVGSLTGQPRCLTRLVVADAAACQLLVAHRSTWCSALVSR
jgi:hypothetical protein